MTTTKDTPRATVTPGGPLTIDAYYVPALPARLRRAIPPRARRYDARAHRWTIAPTHAEAGIVVFRAVFPDGAIITGRGAA